MKYFLPAMADCASISIFCLNNSQTLTGKEIEIDIEPTDKVDRIKERVEEKEGIPPQQQRLIFSGKQMYVLHIDCDWVAKLIRKTATISTDFSYLG